MAPKKRKILVHTCCAACASHVFSELENDGFEVVAYFYNPEVHGLAEYKRRLKDVKSLCQNQNLQLIVPEYDVEDFFAPLFPFQDTKSIKYISDKNRYRRKRCQSCIELLLRCSVAEAKKLRLKRYTTTLLCSPYKDHNEIWNQGVEIGGQKGVEFFYKDFRKGYWRGRNYARNHDFFTPRYCGCNESLEEGRLE